MKIYEKLGLPDIIKDIIEKNYNDIKIIIKNKKDDLMILNIDDFRIINNKAVGLNTEIEINFKFSENNNYLAKFSLGKFVLNNFKKAIIEINIPLINTNVENVFKSLCHELTHLYEFYQNKNKPESNIWKNNYKYFSFSKDYNDTYIKLDLIERLKLLFYFSFSSEINARISSLNTYLSMKKIISNHKNYLKNSLYSTNEWKLYEHLYYFDSNELINNLLKYDEKSVINLFNLFVEKFKIKCELKNINDIKSLIKKIEKYFKSVAASYKKKILKIFSVIITEKFDDGLKKFKDYIDDFYLDIRCLKTIDYYDIYDPIYRKEKDHIEIRLERINFILDPYYKDYLCYKS